MSNNIKYICDIVQDLLPLYVDGVCNDGSKEFVENHLAECSECRQVAEKLKDTTIESSVENERENVLSRHAKKERTAAWKAGTIIAGILLIPILITAIVAATGETSVGTLLVLVASMMLVAAFTVVPLMSKKNRFAKVIVFSTAAIVLIELFVCSFFDGGSFIQTAVPTIFGISLVFFPFVVRGAELPVTLLDKKALIVMSWDTIWLYLTIMAVTLIERNVTACREGVIVGTLFVVLAWLIFAIVKLPKNRINCMSKAGLITVISGVWFALVNDVAALLLEGKRQLFIRDVDFSSWGSTKNLNANIYLLVLICSVLIGAVLLIIGLYRNHRNKISQIH